MSDSHRFFVTCARGTIDLLMDEAEDIGLPQAYIRGGTLVFEGSFAEGMRAVLWMRLANRVLVQLRSFSGTTAGGLYEGVRAIAWEKHLTVDSTFSIDVHGTTSDLRHTHFTALKAKDAIADRLTDVLGSRPNVDPKDADVRIVIRLHGGRVHVSLDLAGQSLHKRGYRKEHVLAPLKETLAAAIVRWSGWDRQETFIDSMCGGGTFCIEAAQWAMNRAPGLGRVHGFTRWPGFDETHSGQWEELCEEARSKALESPPGIIMGNDFDKKAIAATAANIEAAGLQDCIRLTQDDADRIELPPGPGIIVANPPYGERLGDQQESERLLRRYGRAFSRYGGYRAVVFSSLEDVPALMGMDVEASETLMNGPISCGLYGFSEAG